MRLSFERLKTHGSRLPCVLYAAGMLLVAVPAAQAELLTYSLSGSSITGNLGSTSFANASWSMTMTADPTTVVSGTYGVGPGGAVKFDYFYVAGTPAVTVNTGTSTLTATLVPATIGNTVGLISYQRRGSSDVFNQFQELSGTATSPPFVSLGVSSSSLNSLNTIGAFGINQHSNSTDNFNTDQGTLHVERYSNISGAFTIAAAPAPVPEIDPATGSSALSLVAGVLAMVEHRRRRGLAAVLSG